MLVFLSWPLLPLRWAAALSNRGRHLLGDIEATLCTAVGGVKVPLQHGTLDEERSVALTLSRWQVRDLQHLHYEIQCYLELRDIGPIQETEEADPHVPNMYQSHWLHLLQNSLSQRVGRGQ